MKKIATLLFLLATSLSAVEIDGLVGFSPSSPHLFGTAKVHDLVVLGGEVSTKPRFLQYVVGASFLEVPGSHVQNFGVTPLGMRLHVLRHSFVHPYLLANAGIIASTRPIPIPRRDATGLNFLAEFGGGLTIGGRVSVGYKLLHVSNAGTTRYNPGLDNNVFFVSYKIHRNRE